MFNFVKSLDCAVPQTSLSVAASGTYEVGMALKIASGKLTKATGADVVTHICAENKVLTADGLLIAYPVTDAMLFEVPVSAVSASTQVIGLKVTLATDALRVTATAQEGGSKAGAYIVDKLNAKAVGDKIVVRLNYYN